MINEQARTKAQPVHNEQRNFLLLNITVADFVTLRVSGTRGHKLATKWKEPICVV